MLSRVVAAASIVSKDAVNSNSSLVTDFTVSIVSKISSFVVNLRVLLLSLKKYRIFSLAPGEVSGMM